MPLAASMYRLFSTIMIDEEEMKDDEFGAPLGDDSDEAEDEDDAPVIEDEDEETF